eukprot:jgi/Tetstr1/424520/TSEL_015048.t1
MREGGGEEAVTRPPSLISPPTPYARLSINHRCLAPARINHSRPQVRVEPACSERQSSPCRVTFPASAGYSFCGYMASLSMGGMRVALPSRPRAAVTLRRTTAGPAAPLRPATHSLVLRVPGTASAPRPHRLVLAASATASPAPDEGSASPAKQAAAPPAKVKKPRLPYLDSLRFFLIAYIATGHFIAFAAPSTFVMKFFAQVNVVVGAFFVLSGYVAGYVATELNDYKATPRLKPAVNYFVGRVAGYYPLFALVNLLFAPMFLWVDNMYNGPVKAAWHAFVTFTLSASWFPKNAELWNAPTWFLSALTFAMLVLPYALPYIAGWRKDGLRRALLVLTVLSLLAKVAYTYDLGVLTLFEGTLSPRAHPDQMLWNMQRFHPFFATLEVLMGAVAARLVMTDGAEGGEVKTGGLLASPLLPLAGMVGLLVARAAGWLALNDPLTRGLAFIPLFIMFVVNMHRRAVAPGATSPGALASFLSLKPLVYLGALSFPIFVLHGPIGQVFYKKVVATKLWGGTMNVVAGPWFFGVFWLVVLLSAAAVNKFFIENVWVQTKTKEAVQGITARLSPSP